MLMAINPSNSAVQLRARKSSVALHKFAEKFGGGGHPLAAGFPFKMETYLFILGLWEASNEYLVAKQ
jgi:nanoRNase/pAp phosphatase (c-di-AMP/oligoRNAs hydrolase)